MRAISILLGLVLIVSLGSTQQVSAPFYTRLTVTSGEAKLNQEFTLTHSLKALTDLPEIQMIFEIPKGIEFIGGLPIQNFTPSYNDSISLGVTLKVTHPGAYCITCHTIIAPSDTISFLQHFAKKIYIISNSDTTIHSDTSLTGPYFNLASDSIIGEKPANPPPPDVYYTVSGIVKYRNKITNQIEALPGIKVELAGPPNYSTWTDANGHYSITAPAGEYDLIIWAVNGAGEVHDHWYADVTFWLPPVIDLYCSLPPHVFLSQEINLYSNLTINYNAEDNWQHQADWARILWRIRRDKNWMYSHTSPHRVLDYVEVVYPAEIYIDMPLWWSDKIFKLRHNPFFVYFGELEKLFVKSHELSWLGFIEVEDVIYDTPYQIVIDKPNAIWDTTGAIMGLSHEWCHGLMVSTLGGKVPYDWGFAIHSYNSVFNTGHAFSEGFAEFCAPAMWVAELETNQVDPGNDFEPFYANRRYGKDFPWYRGKDTLNTNGTFVEGSVMQFFWDLFDDQNTNDREPNFDDDGVYGGISKIMNTLASVGTIMTEKQWDSDILAQYYIDSITGDTIGADSIIIWSYKSRFPGPNYDFIGKFKDQWQGAGYGNVTELFNVDIHPFNYLDPYPVPKPTNLTANINHIQKKVTLTWNNNAVNQGAFFIYRNLNNSGYVRHY
ncbi:MAG: carboxypeptidase-like regulatory domain-containing protein, partial [candidate division WOR-3 bacterium]